MKTKVCYRCGQINCRCKTHVLTNESSAVRGYDRQWRAFRERVFRQRVREGKAFCAACNRVFGKESPHADHIVPVQSADDPLFYEPSNIQFLHPACHGMKTKRDVRSGLTR